MALRLRVAPTAFSAIGLVSVLVMVGALFPAVGGSIGKLDLPEGVAELLGGADYGTLTGWHRGEIASVYGPLVFAALAIAGISAATAGEEEDRILGLVLAHSVDRSRLVAVKAAAIGVTLLGLAVATWAALITGVALAGGGIGAGDLGALSLHLAFYGAASGAVALAVGAATGRRGPANGAAAGFAILGYLVNGFVPLVDQIEWLQYVSAFHFYAANDPLANGIDPGDMLVLGVFTLALTAYAMFAIRRRDLRG